jgi:hypothetical protein
MLAHGFTGTILTGLVRAGLATVQREAVEADGLPIKFERYRITASGLMGAGGYQRGCRLHQEPDEEKRANVVVGFERVEAQRTDSR